MQTRIVFEPSPKFVALMRRAKNPVKAIGRALYEEANEIFNESQTQVPVRTGALRGSGRVLLPEESPSGVTVVIGYGGAAAPYAIYVHEMTQNNHPIGKAKFLEDPMLAAAPNIPRNLARALERYLETGT